MNYIQHGVSKVWLGVQKDWSTHNKVFKDNNYSKYSVFIPIYWITAYIKIILQKSETIRNKEKSYKIEFRNYNKLRAKRN